MSDAVERIVSAFAKGLMQAMLESENLHRHHAATKRRSRKGASLRVSEESEMPNFPSQQRSELEQAWIEHQAQRASEEQQPELDLEQVFMASKLAQAEFAREPMIQPGPGEDEAQSWLDLK